MTTDRARELPATPDKSPTLDEQIASINELVADELRYGLDNTTSQAIFASLRELKRIRELREVEPVGYIDSEQMKRWDSLRGTEYESPERCYMPFSRQPYKSDLSDCSIPLYGPEVLDLLAAEKLKLAKVMEALRDIDLSQQGMDGQRVSDLVQEAGH